VKAKLLAIVKLLGWFIWFSVGLFFIVAAAGLGAGAMVPGSSAFIGIMTMFFGAMLLVFSELGKTMIGKMRIALDDLQRSFKKAADSVEDEPKQ
jgi:hypothetical protein